MSFSLSAKPGDYSAFAPIVVSGAEGGEPWAKAIMAKGGDHFMRSLDVLGFQMGDTLCLSGGVGPHYARYLPPEALSGQIESRGTALDGAMRLAKSSAINMLRTNR